MYEDITGVRRTDRNTMHPLSPEDKRHLDAAEGWCGLGSFLEANEELENITPQVRAHPKVLEIRWQIYAKLKKWDVALDIARALIKLAPDKPEGWIYTANSLRELKRHEEAYDTLIQAADKFPEDETIAFDIACVCCLLKQFDEAKNWVHTAIDLGGKEIKLRVLDDDDLESLWIHISTI